MLQKSILFLQFMQKKCKKTPGEASRWGKLFRTHCLPSKPIAFSRRVFIVISGEALLSF
jgi:hypothetical protein